MKILRVIKSEMSIFKKCLGYCVKWNTCALYPWRKRDSIGSARHSIRNQRHFRRVHYYIKPMFCKTNPRVVYFPLHHIMRWWNIQTEVTVICGGQPGAYIVAPCCTAGLGTSVSVLRDCPGSTSRSIQYCTVILCHFTLIWRQVQI